MYIIEFIVTYIFFMILIDDEYKVHKWILRPLSKDTDKDDNNKTNNTDKLRL